MLGGYHPPQEHEEQSSGSGTASHRISLTLKEEESIIELKIYMTLIYSATFRTDRHRDVIYGISFL